MNPAAKQLLASLTRPIPERMYHRILFRAKMGHWPNLREPRSFNELMLRKMFSDRRDLIPATADKYLLRSYVTEKLGPAYLPELYLVIETADQLRIQDLPLAYAMKAAHGSGWNRIVSDGELGQQEATQLARDWLSRSYYWHRKEWAYRPLTPRVIFEENLAVDGVAPTDYKFFTFDGVPRMIDVHFDRTGGYARGFYTPEWELLNVRIRRPFPSEPVPAPDSLGEMLEVAGALGTPFDFARIDLYDTGDRVIVGEITHYPGSGVSRFDPPAFIDELGEVWRHHRPIDRRHLRR